MKKINNVFAYCVVFFLLFSACQKQDKKYTITGGVFPANTLNVSTTTPGLADSIKNNTAISFTWGVATFGGQAIPSYNVQIDVPSDTAGGWQNAQTIVLGSNFHADSLTVLALNTALIKVGMVPNIAGTALLRIQSVVIDISSGAAAVDVVPAYSNVIPLTVTPYSLTLYVPSSSYGWNFAYEDTLNVYPDTSGRYEGFAYLPGTGTQSFKYTNTPSFSGVDYGDGGGGTLVKTSGTTSPMTVSTGGYYEVTADFTKNPAVWTATKTTWAIVGDATPKGWTGAFDNEMTYDSIARVWYIDSLPLVSTGSFKFRANDAWSIDFGAVAGTTVVDAATGIISGPLVYVDNPFLPYNNQPNLSITAAQDGTYKVLLDLHISGTYTYSLVPQ